MKSFLKDKVALVTGAENEIYQAQLAIKTIIRREE